MYIYPTKILKMATKKSAKKAAPKKAAKKAPAKKAPAKKAAKKAPAKKAAKKAKAAGPKVKRTPNAAFMRPMNISSSLAEVVGSRPMPRTEVVKKVWEYIKKNNLQDPKERRNINADSNLLRVFGGKKTVSMFEMTKLINKQLS